MMLGMLAELAADFLDDLAGGLADSLDGPGAEEEDNHGSQQSADEDLDPGDINDGVSAGFTELEEGNPVEVSLEEQEGGQAGGDHGITLGQGLGGVADGIQPVGDLADFRAGAGHLVDAVGVIGDRAEGIHGKDVRAGHQHAHGGDGRAEGAGARRRRSCCAEPDRPAAGQTPMTMAVAKVVSKPTATPMTILVAGPVLEASAMILDRLVARFGVVLGNEDDDDAGDDTDHARRRRATSCPSMTVDGNGQADDGQGDGYEVAAVEGVHGILVLLWP